MNAVKSFTIYEEYYDLITLLNVNEQKDILLAIMKYMFEDDDISLLLSDKELKIFKNLKRPLDKSKNKSKSTIKIKSKQNQNEIKKKTHQDVNVSNYDNNYVVNVNVNNKKFIKPKLEEIKEYCKERNNNVDAERFYNFYESKGWMVGKNKMKDWKASVRTWEQKEDKLPQWFNENYKKDMQNLDELEKVLEEFK